MGFGVFVFEPLNRYMGVDLRGREGRMTEHLLHAAKVSPRIQQMRRKTVSQLVRCQIGRQFGLGDRACYDRAVCEGRTAFARFRLWRRAFRVRRVNHAVKDGCFEDLERLKASDGASRGCSNDSEGTIPLLSSENSEGTVPLLRR